MHPCMANICLLLMMSRLHHQCVFVPVHISPQRLHLQWFLGLLLHTVTLFLIKRHWTVKLGFVLEELPKPEPRPWCLSPFYLGGKTQRNLAGGFEILLFILSFPFFFLSSTSTDFHSSS